MCENIYSVKTEKQYMTTIVELWFILLIQRRFINKTSNTSKQNEKNDVTKFVCHHRVIYDMNSLLTLDITSNTLIL